MKLLRKQFWRKRRLWPRYALQFLFFSLVALFSLNQTLVQNGGGLPFFQNISLHALCPFGGVETLAHLLITGTLLQKVRVSAVFLLELVFILAVLFGPVFCGWVCPLGTVQEWVGKMGRHWFGTRRYNHFIPRRLDVILRYARYLVLTWVLYLTLRSASLVFQDYDPYFALFHFWRGEVAPTALLILEITLFLALFVERPWCKYACPLGAVLGLSNLIRIFTIQRRAGTCLQKGEACTTLCPMNIPVSQKTVVRDHQCLTCLECTSEAGCPVSGTVFLGTEARP